MLREVLPDLFFLALVFAFTLSASERARRRSLESRRSRRKAAGAASRRCSSSVALQTEGIRAANRDVFRLGTGQRRPGTTVAAMLWARDRFIVAHVGDSRVHRLRRGAFVQLTRDHSLANEFVDLGRLKPEEAADFPQRHVLMRAVGTRQDVKVNVQVSPVLLGDVFLLASDGLEVLGCHDIEAVLQLPPAAAVDRLIALSLAEGAPHNVTVIVARIGGAERSLKGRLL